MDGRKAGNSWPRGLGHGDGHLPGLLTEVSTARVLEKRGSKLLAEQFYRGAAKCQPLAMEQAAEWRPASPASNPQFLV